MLKRSDLAKQFELVVQQEIKNFNDRSYSLQQTINSLQSNIDGLGESSTKKNSELLSKQKSLEIEIEKIKAFQQETSQNLDRHINDTNRVMQNLIEKVEFTLNTALMATSNQESNKEQLESIRYSIKSIEEEVARHYLLLSHSMDQLAFKLNKDLIRMKEEIISMPSDSLEIKKQLDEKIDTYVVDAQGILREIKVMNKSVFIIEKKIENLYTLIERLQKDKRE